MRNVSISYGDEPHNCKQKTDWIDDPLFADPDAGASGATPKDKTIPKHIDEDPELTRELVGAILGEEDLLGWATNNIKPNDFIDQTHKAMLQIAYQHYQDFGTAPSEAVLRVEIKRRFAEHKSLPAMLAQLKCTVGDYQVGMRSLDYLKKELSNWARIMATKKCQHKFFEECEKRETDIAALAATLIADMSAAASLCQDDEDDLFSILELQDEDDLTWQVADHIPKNGCITIFGPSDVGKSFYSLEMGLRVATGTPFLNKWDTHKGSVLYICAEGGYGLKNRVNAWLAANGFADTTDLKIAFAKRPYDMTDRGAVDGLLARAAKKLGTIDLVFIDTLSRNFGGGDPDKTADMMAYLNKGVDYIREKTKATVVNIHHTGWSDATREKNAKTLRDYSDTSISLLKNGELIEVCCKKQKDAAPFDPYLLEKQVVNGSLVLSLSGSKAEAKQHLAEAEQNAKETELINLVPVADVVDDVPEHTITVADLAKVLNCDRSTVSRRCEALLSRNAIQRYRSGGANTSFGYYRDALLM